MIKSKQKCNNYGNKISFHLHFKCNRLHHHGWLCHYMFNGYTFNGSLFLNFYQIYSIMFSTLCASTQALVNCISTQFQLTITQKGSLQNNTQYFSTHILYKHSLDTFYQVQCIEKISFIISQKSVEVSIISKFTLSVQVHKIWVTKSKSVCFKNTLVTSLHILHQ